MHGAARIIRWLAEQPWAGLEQFKLSLIVKILAPLLIRMANHAHDVAAGVQ